MKLVEIERRSMSWGREAIAAYFEAGPARPCIFTDASGSWDASSKWSFDFFADRYGAVFGLVRLGFHDPSYPGKLTRLGAFIETMDRPFSELPGFWVEGDKTPCKQVPVFDESDIWCFEWSPMREDMGLLDDVSPFPDGMPNLVYSMTPGVYHSCAAIAGRDFHSIYISRRGTVTPMHIDHSHTIGCLVQFVGRKQVTLLAPPEEALRDGVPFDPEKPDFETFPQLLDATAFRDVLSPGEMLIIPPDWWHHTLSLDHSITLSHNFFNHVNFDGFCHSLLVRLSGSGKTDKILAKVTQHIAAGGDGQAD